MMAFREIYITHLQSLRKEPTESNSYLSIEYPKGNVVTVDICIILQQGRKWL